jgi:hypothetical protein
MNWTLIAMTKTKMRRSPTFSNLVPYQQISMDFFTFLNPITEENTRSPFDFQQQNESSILLGGGLLCWGLNCMP